MIAFGAVWCAKVLTESTRVSSYHVFCRGRRVWPKHDEDLVNAFISLVFHCTGVKVKASFAAASETGTNNLYGTLDRAESLQVLWLLLCCPPVKGKGLGRQQRGPGGQAIGPACNCMPEGACSLCLLPARQCKG